MNFSSFMKRWRKTISECSYNHTMCYTLLHYDNRWFCHVDDDTYVNVPELKKTLIALYNHKPQYAGHYPRYNIHRKKAGVPVSNILYIILI